MEINEATLVLQETFDLLPRKLPKVLQQFAKISQRDITHETLPEIKDNEEQHKLRVFLMITDGLEYAFSAQHVENEKLFPLIRRIRNCVSTKQKKLRIHKVKTVLLHKVF